MISSIIIGSGNKRQKFDLPCSNNRKEHVEKRIAVGNVVKSKFLWPAGNGFKKAKERGLAALSYNAGQ